MKKLSNIIKFLFGALKFLCFLRKKSDATDLNEPFNLVPRDINSEVKSSKKNLKND